MESSVALLNEYRFSRNLFKPTFLDISLVHYSRGGLCYLYNEQIHPTLNFTFSPFRIVFDWRAILFNSWMLCFVLWRLHGMRKFFFSYFTASICKELRIKRILHITFRNGFLWITNDSNKFFFFFLVEGKCSYTWLSVVTQLEMWGHLFYLFKFLNFDSTCKTVKLH